MERIPPLPVLGMQRIYSGLSAEIFLYLSLDHAVRHNKGLVLNGDAYLIFCNRAILSLDRSHDRIALKNPFFSVARKNAAAAGYSGLDTGQNRRNVITDCQRKYMCHLKPPKVSVFD